MRSAYQSPLLLATLLTIGFMVPLQAGAERMSTVVVNGVPFKIRSYEQRGTPTDIATATARRWSSNGPAPLSWSGEGGRIVLGRQRGPFHETLSLLPAERPGYTLLHHALRDFRQPLLAADLPPLRTPSDWKKLSAVRHGSSGQAPQTFLFSTERTVDVVIRQIADALRAAGWVTPRVVRKDGAVIWSERGSQRLEAVVTVDGRHARIVMQVGGHAH